MTELFENVTYKKKGELLAMVVCSLMEHAISEEDYAKLFSTLTKCTECMFELGCVDLEDCTLFLRFNYKPTAEVQICLMASGVYEVDTISLYEYLPLTLDSRMAIYVAGVVENLYHSIFNN